MNIYDQGQYLTFLQGEETFAVGLLHVKEIIEQYKLTRVPMMPEQVLGVINIRGNVVPVIDLKARLGLGKSQRTKRTCIIILEVEIDETLQPIGALVDSVQTVLDISPASIEPTPRFGARIRSDFIRGMSKLGNQFIAILQVDKVLSVEDIATLPRAEEPRHTAA